MTLPFPTAEDPVLHDPALHDPRQGRLSSRAASTDLRAVAILSWRLFRRDVAAKYRYAALGVLWAVITPLFLVGLLLALNSSGVVRTESSGNLPYVVFAITGVTIWGIFSTGISSAAESLNSAGATILRMNFPRASLVLAALGMGLFEFLVRLPVAIAVWLAYGCDLSFFGLLLGLLSLLPLLALTMALGMVAAVGAVMVRDVLHMIPIGLTLLMLLSPVLYTFPPQSPLGRVNDFNPLSHFLVTARTLFGGDYHVSVGYWFSSLFAVVLLALACRLFRVAQSKILERM